MKKQDVRILVNNIEPGIPPPRPPVHVSPLPSLPDLEPPPICTVDLCNVAIAVVPPGAYTHPLTLRSFCSRLTAAWTRRRSSSNARA